MIFFHVWTLFSFFVRCLLGSEVPAETDVINRGNIENLADDLLIKISQYLKCHTVEFSALNRRFHDVFTRKHSFARAVSLRFKIPELHKSTFVKDLKLFKELSFIPDDVSKFYLLQNHLLNYGTFTGNVVPLVLHMLKLCQNLADETFKTPQRKIFFKEFPTKLLKFLIKESAYDVIVTIINEYSKIIVVGMEAFDVAAAFNLIKFIGTYPQEEAHKLYVKLFRLINATPKRNYNFSNVLFLMISPIYFQSDILDEFEHEIGTDYLKFILSTPLKAKTIEYLRPKLFDKDNKCINHHHLFKLYATMRFYPRITENSYENLNETESFGLFMAASTSNKKEIATKLASMYAANIFNAFKNFKDVVSAKCLIDLLPHLNQDQIDELMNFNYYYFVKLLLEKAACTEAKRYEDDEERLFYVMKSSPELVYFGAPKTFQFNATVNPFIMFQMTDFYHEDSMLTFLTDLFYGIVENNVLQIEIDRRFLNLKGQVYHKIIRSERIRAQFGFLCRISYTTDDFEKAVILKSFSETGGLVFCNFINTMCVPIQFLITKFQTDAEFDTMVEHYERPLIQLMDRHLSLDVNYGEVRSALLYALRRETERQQFGEFSRIHLLRQLAVEFPDDVLALRPNLYEDPTVEQEVAADNGAANAAGDAADAQVADNANAADDAQVEDIADAADDAQVEDNADAVDDAQVEA